MMTKRTLAPCVACGRHVRASEVRCPFCAEALPLERAPSVSDAATPSVRMSRAAIIAFGLTMAASACASNTAGSPPEGTITQGGSSGGEGASTGGGVDSDAGAPVSSDDAGAPSPDGGAVAPMYGAPVARYGAPAPIDDVL